MFTKVQTHKDQDRNCNLVEYVHSSGLRHFHLESSFPELSYALTLKTPPEDDTGTPHILEHLTLCGSQKYPVKDPFFAMQSRSVAHDLNASTGPLNTCYHFATTLENDFLNLSDLYSDLVFNPLLRQVDFEQEGWRLEKNSEGFELKGVVLNEMKGAYTQQNMGVFTAQMNILAPNAPTRFSFGGEPNAILGLTYEKIKDFHRRYYSPQNAVLTTSGDVPIEKLHAQLDEIINRHLKNVSQHPVHHVPVSEKGLNPPNIEVQPSEKNNSYAFVGYGPETDQLNLSMYHVFQGPKNAKEDLIDQLMHRILFELSDNPFTQLGVDEKVSISSSYIYEELMSTQQQAGLSIAIRNIPKNDIEKQKRLKEKVQELCQNLQQKVITKEQWQNTIKEFQRSILSKIDESPRHEVASLGASILWGVDPLRNSNNTALFKDLFDNVPTQEDIKHWVQSRLSLDPVWFQTTTSPDLPQQWEKYEQTQIEEMISSGFEPAVLEKAQPHEEDQLPTLLAENISVNFCSSDVSVSLRENHPSHTHLQVQAQAGSVSLLTSLSSLTIDEIAMLNIFCNARKSLGSDSKTKKQLRQYIESVGVGCSHGVRIDATPSRAPAVLFEIESTSMNEEAGVKELSVSIFDNFNPPVFEEREWSNTFHQMHQNLIKNEERLKNALKSTSANAPFSQKAALQHQLAMFDEQQQEEYLEKFAKDPRQAEKIWTDLLNKIKTLPKHIISVGEQGFFQEAEIVQKTTLAPTWDHLNQTPAYNIEKPQVPSRLQLFKAPQGVNHCQRVIEGPVWSSPDFVSIKLALELLDNTLHEEIREKGGAYGSQVQSQSGLIVFGSFRDPNVDKTFNVWDNASSYLQEIIDQRDPIALQEAKLSIVKNFLSPKTPLSRAFEKISYMFTDVSTSDLEKFVKDVMDTDYHDIQKALHYFSPPQNRISDAATVPLNYTPVLSPTTSL